MRNTEKGPRDEFFMHPGAMPKEYPHEQSEVLEISNIFSASDPSALKERINDFMRDHGNSEAEMTRIADELCRRNEELEAAVSQGNMTGKPSKSFKSSEGVRELYEKVVKNKNRVLFVDFLRTYLEEVAPVFIRKYSSRMSGEKLSMDARKEEERSAEERDEIEAKKQEIRTELLEQAEGCRHPNYNSKDRAQLARIKYGFRQKRAAEDKEDVEMIDKVHEEESLVSFIMQREKLFGEKSEALPTSEFDDYVTRADFALTLNKDLPVLLVDVTHDQRKFGEKIFYNIEHALRVLKYPPNADLKNKPGVPVVLGMSVGHMRESIDEFLEKDAKERLGMNAGENGKRAVEGFSAWAGYINKQLLYQRNALSEYALGLQDADERARYEKATQMYDGLIHYFWNLEKEKRSLEKDNSPKERDSGWKSRHLNIEAEVAPYVQAANPVPKIEGV